MDACTARTGWRYTLGRFRRLRIKISIKESKSMNATAKCMTKLVRGVGDSVSEAFKHAGDKHSMQELKTSFSVSWAGETLPVIVQIAGTNCSK